MVKGKIKVLQILTRLIGGGADENTLYIVSGVDKNRFESHLLVGGDSEIVDKARSKGIMIINEKNLVRNINPFRDLLALFKIIFYIKKGKYDIIHTHTAKAGFIGRLAAIFAGAPIIIHSLHGLSFHDFMPSWQKKLYIMLEKIVGKYTDLFISVGNNIKQKSIDEGIGKKDKYVTIYSGMDLSKFDNISINKSELRKSLNIAPKDLIIGTVVRLEPRKGPQYFVDIIHNICEQVRDFKAVIVGIGPFEPELRTKIEKNNLQDLIILTGYRKDIAEIMSIFDIICLTSLWEGIPRVLIQGSKLKKPLVAFDIDGNSEIIRHGINGFLIPPLEIEEFSAALQKLANDGELRKNMSQANENIVDNRWDKDHMCQAIEVEYKKLVKSKLHSR